MLFRSYREKGIRIGKMTHIQTIHESTDLIQIIVVTDLGIALYGEIVNIYDESGSRKYVISFNKEKTFITSLINKSGYKPIEIVDNPPILILKNKNNIQIMQGGYYDGKIRIISLLNESNLKVLKTYCKTITALCIDESEQFLIAGSIIGETIIYCMTNTGKWNLVRFMMDHSDTVTSICISDEMQLYATSSLDSTVNIYNKGISPKLIRTIRNHNNFAVDIVFVLLIICLASFQSYTIYFNV